MEKHYWGCRINKEEIDYFRQQLDKGVLRQGWGYDEGQNLRNLTVDDGARRNLAIFNKVKRGDLLLIPRCPSWEEVAIAEATEDFDKGYKYSIDPNIGDYGHCFPAKMLKSFERTNEHISGKVRSTIKNISRFWNIDHCGGDIEKILKIDSKKLRSSDSFELSFEKTVTDAYEEAFDSKLFKENMYSNLITKFSNEEWEYALVEGLRKYLPEPIIVERTGGTSEVEHGTDIVIKYPGLSGYQYIVAIQVKDFEGVVSEDPIAQINKADKYWNNENSKLIEKILIITKATKEENRKLQKKKGDVKIVFANELKDVLYEIGKSYLGIMKY